MDHVTFRTTGDSDSAAPRLQGNRAGVGTLYRRYALWLGGILRRKFGNELSDELAQEAFMRVAPVEALHEIPHPKALLMTIATNLARDQRRQIGRRGGAHLALEDIAALDEPRIAPDQDTSLLLKQIILSLPPLYRDAFVLNRFIGLTYAEIAQRYGITQKAVEYRMSRALALCQEALRD